jgi:hypothetical protein
MGFPLHAQEQGHDSTLHVITSISIVYHLWAHDRDCGHLYNLYDKPVPFLCTRVQVPWMNLGPSLSTPSAPSSVRATAEAWPAAMPGPYAPPGDPMAPLLAVGLGAWRGVQPTTQTKPGSFQATAAVATV